MKIEEREKIVKYKVFVANDGKEFYTEFDCINHEKILNKERKVCPKCNGKGIVEVEESWDNYHTGITEKSYIYPTCDLCNGKGYLEKKIVWK